MMIETLPLTAHGSLDPPCAGDRRGQDLAGDAPAVQHRFQRGAFLIRIVQRRRRPLAQQLRNVMHRCRQFGAAKHQIVFAVRGQQAGVAPVLASSAAVATQGRPI